MVRRNVIGVKAQFVVCALRASGCLVGLFLGRPLGRLTMSTEFCANTDAGSPPGDVVVMLGMARCSVRGRPLPPLPVLPLERLMFRGRPLHTLIFSLHQTGYKSFFRPRY